MLMAQFKWTIKYGRASFWESFSRRVCVEEPGSLPQTAQPCAAANLIII